MGIFEAVTKKFKRPRQVTAEIVDDVAGNKHLLDIYPAWESVNRREALMVGLPAGGSAYFPTNPALPFGVNSDMEKSLASSGGDAMPYKFSLPKTRVARYVQYRRMAQDPTISSALKMHIANALSASSDTVDSVNIESVQDNEKPDNIVEDLKRALLPYIRKDLNEWARKAAVYGSCFVRVYGKEGKGIENIRCDHTTHPAYILKWEKGGRLAGFTSTYQGANTHSKIIQLLPPWYFVGFEIPEWEVVDYCPPVSVSGIPIDLAMTDYDAEGLYESQDYGNSLLATAYEPWMDLLDALCSMKMSRRNAARLERIIAVNVGKMDPERAAKFMNAIAERITNASRKIQEQSFLFGNVQTVDNHIVPVFSDKGGITVEAVQGSPDINGIEDVMFHIKRLGGALGVDPALLGFGDFLSGGLGDGGFFRVSVIASKQATYLRKALQNGIQRLCEIHVAYKYGKVFMPDNCPWKITFNSVSTAMEREEQENMETRAAQVSQFIGTLGVIDQELNFADKRELVREVWKRNGYDDEAFDRVFPESKKAEAEAAAKQAEQDEDEED